ncbi:DDE-domain-containing protein [Parathielavia appendiculata]|uniref:DDE-domain-containing protein n=1 Tax=Parathielavia appendiculata TaxID=2587402 RepID=A0AAN6U7N4_9PEZI|nr:DDE-domain-containing protein [Parathielavia appendiculata]
MPSAGLSLSLLRIRILAAQYHLANWYTECNLPTDWRIATTDNGCTTNAVGLEWIKHFDYHTARRTKGKYRLLILDGYESHHSTEFELYCQCHGGTGGQSNDNCIRAKLHLGSIPSGTGRLDGQDVAQGATADLAAARCRIFNPQGPPHAGPHPWVLAGTAQSP